MKAFVTIIALIIVAELFLLYGGGEKTLTQYADQVMETCASAKHKPSCYDEEIPNLMDYISYEDSFEVTRIVQERDKDYWYCHVLGHNLSARETAKDPNRWMDVVARAPSGICSNGAIHGAFQERFRVEILSDEGIQEIMPDLRAVCEKREGFSPTGLEQASCYHALGHLTMYMTGADIYKSLDVCDQITTGYKQMCYDGAFMQIYQPLEPEDFALVTNIAPQNREESIEFCEQFEGDDFTESTCIRESWPLWRTEIVKAEGVLDFCNMMPNDKEKKRCFNAIFYVNAPQLGFNVERIGNLCGELPTNVKGQCFANSASRMIETDYRLSDSSVLLCEMAEEAGVGETCWNELSFYASFNYHPGSPESTALCEALPERWEKKCLASAITTLDL